MSVAVEQEHVEQMKTFWLSFRNNKGFAGVCIVDVSEDAALATKLKLDIDFPNHLPGAEWVAAATAIALAAGCNPGGQVMSYELAAGGTGSQVMSYELPNNIVAPRNRLMQREELKELELIEERGN